MLDRVLGFTEIDAEVSHTPDYRIQSPIHSSLERIRFEIRDFKFLVERQLYKDILVGGKPQENIARALLQASLTSRSYREVPVRGGQSDLLLFSNDGKFLFETKVWRGAEYYAQGLRELEEYIIGEGDDYNLAGAFYIVFDGTKSNRACEFLGDSILTERIHNLDVDVFIINLSLPQPSRKSITL